MEYVIQFLMQNASYLLFQTSDFKASMYYVTCFIGKEVCLIFVSFLLQNLSMSMPTVFCNILQSDNYT